MKKEILVGLAAAASLMAGTATAFEAGDVLVRVGMTNVDPKTDNGSIDSGVPIVGGAQIDVDDDTQVGFTGEYFITPSLGVELLASLPFEHDVSVNGTQIGSTKHLPPTLSLNYHFNTNGNFIPYVGAGINYTNFFDEDDNGVLGQTLGADVDFELDDSWGVAVQAGVDMLVQENTMINFSVRWADIDTDVDVSGVGTVGEAEIDPIIISLMLGYKF